MQTAGPNILIVDDEVHVCELIKDVLEERGLQCVMANDARQARQLLASRPFTVMVTDLVMPQVSGLELLSYTRGTAPGCKVILITGMGQTHDLAEAISLGAYDYFQKPFDVEQLAKAVLSAISPGGREQLSFKAAHALQLAAQSKQVSVEAIRALVQTVEAKDPYTRKHSEQVARYAVELARYAGADDRTIHSIQVAALLHDVGKIGVPDHILTKPGALDEEEFRMIRRHPALGSEILEKISMFAREAVVVRHHHEAWDGSGYPDGLAAEAIPWASRILNVADSLDAMLMARTYKQAYPVHKTLDEVARCAGSQFDPRIAALTLQWAATNRHVLELASHKAADQAAC